jgi:small GTP-binding protein
MPNERYYKFKICLIGEPTVGKTSLVNKFVHNMFDDKYITTLGTKPSKKKIKCKHPKDDGNADISLVIWDIMGQRGFLQLLQEAYFSGAQGIIAVCDNTRKDTLSDLDNWINAVYKVTEEIPIVILGNKCDLEEDQEVVLDDLMEFASGYEKTISYLTSAKTGQNVEEAFATLCKFILEETK